MRSMTAVKTACVVFPPRSKEAGIPNSHKSLFERNQRFAGDVKYTFRKSLTLAIDGLVSFSKVPLRLSTYVGLGAAVLALFMALLVLYWRITAPESPLTGLAAINVVNFFLGSVQLVCIGILGEYIGRIYEEVKGRPLYTIGEVAGFSAGAGQPKFADQK